MSLVGNFLSRVFNKLGWGNPVWRTHDVTIGEENSEHVSVTAEEFNLFADLPPPPQDGQRELTLEEITAYLGRLVRYEVDETGPGNLVYDSERGAYVDPSTQVADSADRSSLARKEGPAETEPLDPKLP